MKRLIALSLAFALLASLFSFTASAETSGDFEYTVTDGKATITKYLGAGGDVVIPSTLGGYPVKTIGTEAFIRCESMTSVSIPDSVTTLESFAFSGCTGLTSLVLPDSIKTIGWTFGGCTSLISVTLPDGLEELGNSAFTGCTALTSISFPSTMTTLRRYSFYGCQSLKQVVIPKSITTIEATVFFNCPNIETVYYEGTEDEWEAIDWQKSYGRTENKDLYTASIIFNAALTPDTLAVLNQAINALISVKARPGFAFRSDLTNTAAGEASPIESDYYLSAYKVTNEQYAAFVSETGHKAPSYWKDGTYPAGKDDHPVLNVSYSDAAAYCEWLNSKTEEWSFRLPTEAEWENAARGSYYDDNSMKYPDGSSSPRYDASTGELTSSFNYNGVIASELLRAYGSEYVVNYVKGDYAGTSETLGECISISATGGVTNWANHGGSATKGYFLQTDLYALVSADGGNTTPVGSYPANTLGLYDMAGNSWDLTSSMIVANNGLEKGVFCYAVRGGSWYATARSCTLSYRGEGRKDSPSSTVGFRLAADRKQEVSGVLWGDANGDGSVDNKDIVRLKNYFANLNDYTGLSTVEIFRGADANGDGTVSNKDIVRLKNYFANFDDETKTSSVILGPEND